MKMKVKRLKLKKGITNILIAISILSTLALSIDSYNLKTFILSKLMLLGILLINTTLLTKYSDVFKGAIEID